MDAPLLAENVHRYAEKRREDETRSVTPVDGYYLAKSGMNQYKFANLIKKVVENN